MNSKLPPNNLPFGRIAYSVKEFITMTKLGRTTVYRLIQKKEIETRRVGTKILIPSWAVEEFLGKKD